MTPESTPASQKSSPPGPELPDPVEALLEDCLRGEPEGWWDAVEDAARRAPDHARDLRGRFAAIFELGGLHGDVAAGLPQTIDDLEVLDELGRGGMGIVYRAHEPSLGRDVAVKVVRPSRLEFEGAAARFQREVEAMAQLSHPGIVTIHRVGLHRAGGHHGLEGPVPYFTMELLAGASLAQVSESLRERSPESLDGRDFFHAVGGVGSAPAAFQGPWSLIAARVVRDVARALHHAHGRDVIHRDVKPSNILVEPTGRAVLLDFGLTSSASGASATASSSAPVGTFAYMAPEQWAGKSVGPPADVFGLGATLYQLLALAPPFEGATALELRAAIDDGEAPALRTRNRAVTRDLALVQAKAMDHRPADRYRSAEAFADDLDRVLEGKPVHAAPPGPLVRWARRAKRRPAQAAAWSLGTILFVGGPTVYGALAQRHAGAMERVAQAESLAKESAVAARVELEDVLAFTQGLFDSARPEINGGRARSAVDMLREGARSAATLAAAPGSRARIELTLGTLFSLLAEPQAAAGPLESALSFYREQPVPARGARLAQALRLAGHNHALLGRHEQALALAVEALAAATDQFGGSEVQTVPFHMTLADIHAMAGDHASAALSRAHALGILTATGAPEHRLMEARALLGAALIESGEKGRGRALTASAAAWARADIRRASTAFWLAELTLAEHDFEAGETQASLERATRLYTEISERAGSGSLLTAQAGLVRARILGAGRDHQGALAQLRSVRAAMTEVLPPTHRLLLDTDRSLIAVMTNLGMSEEVLALEAERQVAAGAEGAFGEASDEHARLRMAIGLAAQARGQNAEALTHLEALERSRRAMAPWTGPHSDAALLLVAHRMRMGQNLPPPGHQLSIDLLEEMIETIGPGELPVVSSANGQTYEGGTMARLFLAGILEQSPAAAPRAAALKAEAESRKRAIMSRAAAK